MSPASVPVWTPDELRARIADRLARSLALHPSRSPEYRVVGVPAVELQALLDLSAPPAVCAARGVA